MKFPLLLAAVLSVTHALRGSVEDIKELDGDYETELRSIEDAKIIDSTPKCKAQTFVGEIFMVETHSHRTEYVLETDDSAFTLLGEVLSSAIDTISHVTGCLADEGGSILVDSIERSTPVSPPIEKRSGTTKILIVPLWPDTSNAPSMATMTARYTTNSDSCKVEMEFASRGTETFDFTILDPGQNDIPTGDRRCNLSFWIRRGKKRIRDVAGVSKGDFEYIQMVFPRPSEWDCWGGIARRPGKWSASLWGGVPDTATHEFGHNLGLLHASSYENCNYSTEAMNPFTNGYHSGCDVDEYGDVYSKRWVVRAYQRTSVFITTRPLGTRCNSSMLVDLLVVRSTWNCVLIQVL